MPQVKVKLYNQKAEEIGEEKLNSDIFGVKISSELIRQVVVAQNNNSRQVLAHTKDRSEVRGGGKKPWKQKGTGRARVGSSRSPIWIGGGVTFGPTKNRNFSVKINKKMKKKALFMCLSDRVKDNDLILLDKIEIKEIKTKAIVDILEKLNNKVVVKNKKEKFNVLLVLENKLDKVFKSVKNIDKVGVIRAESLNVVDILKYQYLLTTVQAVKVIEKVYSNK